jgi:outer membrane protein OmpA-like peptidoglycan-associated protein
MGKYSIAGAGLLLWGALLWYCIPHDWHHIEHDLMTRSMALLDENKIPSNGLNIDGRDITLTGDEGTAAVSDNAVKLVAAVWGVRSVRTEILRKPEPPKAVVTAAQADEAAKSITGILKLKNVEFYTNTDRLTPDGQSTLDQVAGVLSRYGAMPVEIAGHTDSMGTPEMNLRLSRARAASVKQYLIGKGIAAANLTDVGFGQAQPIASNQTAAGRQANRRVEFHTKETK